MEDIIKNLLIFMIKTSVFRSYKWNKLKKKKSEMQPKKDNVKLKISLGVALKIQTLNQIK